MNKNKISVEERVLYNVLKSIGTGDESKTSPDNEYLKSLENLGFIKMGWDNSITDLGSSILSGLKNKIEVW